MPNVHKKKLSSIEELRSFFERNGYIRQKNKLRMKQEPRTYKKGYEVRLLAFSLEELKVIRRLLKDSGFKPGRAFQKTNRYCQPIYGKVQVERFLKLLGEDIADEI